MRSLILAAAVAMGTAAFAADVRAQIPITSQRSSVWVTPTPFYVPPQRSIATFRSPYGYRSFVEQDVSPVPYGVTTYQRSGVTVQPYSQGRYHSVYYDPFTRTYRYTTGTQNSVNYRYSFGR